MECAEGRRGQHHANVVLEARLAAGDRFVLDVKPMHQKSLRDKERDVRAGTTATIDRNLWLVHQTNGEHQVVANLAIFRGVIVLADGITGHWSPLRKGARPNIRKQMRHVIRFSQIYFLAAQY